ncbi:MULTISPECIES: YitT family protein [unclassified Lactococcus]|uniref:YitT family protein n=1 Tax=unclassified Lactococcus TaxID=2643510 RepID=UPI0011CA074D|nr:MULTISPECIES: YitT family protein [unclassified Lactococcus]MQW23981.1 YitT family protein [Lactococcus sp. dk101]TXK36923.1 YitT family protein [Lactococcus sp. dk310]TXK47094.1 YitT family protein [Lactococcus sp. dk322]
MNLFNVKIDKKFLRDLIILIFGVGLYILSVRLFVIPNRLASNGIAGFSVLINFVFHINPALTFFVVNVPLFLFGWRLLSNRVLLLSIPGAAAMSIWMLIFESIGVNGIVFNQMIWAGLFDGILSGIGAGIVVISEGTFGGSLLLSRMMEDQWNFKIDRVLFGIDLVVMILSLLTYLALPNFAVTLLSSLIFSKVTRFVGRPDYRNKILKQLRLNFLGK